LAETWPQFSMNRVVAQEGSYVVEPDPHEARITKGNLNSDGKECSRALPPCRLKLIFGW
jgi:hypothetical protein